MAISNMNQGAYMALDQGAWQKSKAPPVAGGRPLPQRVLGGPFVGPLRGPTYYMRDLAELVEGRGKKDAILG